MGCHVCRVTCDNVHVCVVYGMRTILLVLEWNSVEFLPICSLAMVLGIV